MDKKENFEMVDRTKSPAIGGGRRLRTLKKMMLEFRPSRSYSYLIDCFDIQAESILMGVSVNPKAI